jgi:hypothetical protein
MGSNQHKNVNTVKVDPNSMGVTHSRLMNSVEAGKFNVSNKDRLRIEPFKRLLGWELELEGIATSLPTSTLLTS